MSDIATVGLDTAKSVFRSTASMRKVKLSFVASYGGARFFHTFASYLPA